LGIRARTAAVVTVTMLVLMALMIVTARSVIQGGFAKLERRDTEKSVRLARNWIAGQTPAMGATAVSYGAWTPTYRFIVDHDRRYVESYMRDVDIDSLKIDFMVFIDESGRIVYAKYLDPQTRHARPLPKGLREYLLSRPAAFDFSDPFTSTNGVVGLPEGTVALGAAPIVTSQSKGPIRGTLVAGRFLSEKDKETLAKAIGLDATWYSVATTGLPADVRSALDRVVGGGELVEPVDDSTVVGYGVLDGLGKKPAVVVKVDLERTIVAQGRAVLNYTVVGLVIFIVVSIIALLIVLNTSVLSRLARLSQRVMEIGASEEPAGRVEIGGEDEVARLATSINGMLAALDRSRQELVEMATHDPLTHVFNRRRFEEELSRELAEQERLGHGGALLWFDLDNFKDINDEFGHRVGDAVLVRFADALREQMRRYSTLGRLGGDEFVMVIPGADEEEALRAAQRLLDQLGSRTYTVARHEIQLSTSIGVALFPRDGTTVEELLARADTAMYEAKRAGRGRVTSYVAVSRGS
jgi:diguanylate cyclase (GGDEF)-like protein